MNACPVPSNGEFFYVVKPGDTLSRIVKEAYRPSSHNVWMKKVAEVATRSHIKDPNRIYPGQFIALPPVDALATLYPIYENDLREMERIWAATPREAQRVVENNWDVLDYLSGANAVFSPLVGAAGAVSKGTLKELKPPKPVVEIMQQTVVRITQQTFLTVRNQSIRLIRQTGIQVSRLKIIRVTMDVGGLRAYASQLQKLTRLSKVFKNAGYVTLAIDVGIAGKRVYDDWDTKTRYRTMASQTTKVGFGVMGGAITTYYVCNVMLGLPTVGSSIFWCGLIAGGVGMAGFAKIGEWGAKATYDAVNKTSFNVPSLP